VAKKTAISRYLAEIGRKGGQAKVPKGVAALSPEERKERAREAALKGWAKKRAEKKAGKKK
jgi:general stress protein YciG